MHEECRLLLCPEISHSQIVNRCQLIQSQLKRSVDSTLLEDVPKHKPFQCECGNQDPNQVYEDDVEGITTCTQCGLVLQTHCFYKESPTLTLESSSVYELYSDQDPYRSQWKKSNKYSRLNLSIERDLVKFGREDTLTSDLYKDYKCKEVYA